MTIKELEAYIKKLTDSGTPQGISFVVVRNNQIIYSKGFGWADHPHKIPATPDAVYHWYSMTKIVTAMAVFQLQEKGALQLDDPVVRYLSFFKVKYPSDSSKIVTIRDLLTRVMSFSIFCIFLGKEDSRPSRKNFKKSQAI